MSFEIGTLKVGCKACGNSELLRLERGVEPLGAAALGLEPSKQEAEVTLCYRRRRSLPDWPYNLYCMVHGKTRDDVAPVVARLAALAGVEPAVLFSVRRFKQCGARYFAGAAA